LRRRRENFGILSHSKGNFNENLWNCKQQSKQQQQSQCMPSLNPPTPSHPWGGDSPSGPTLHRLTVPIPLLTGKAKKIEITYFSCDCEDANPLGKIIQAQMATFLANQTMSAQSLRRDGRPEWQRLQTPNPPLGGQSSKN